MAITIINTQRYTDVNFNFISNPNTGDVAIVSDINSIKQSVLNILRTNHGEKPFNPLFGANLDKYLFENINQITAEAIIVSIEESILNFEPRVEILNINIGGDPDLNRVRIELTVKIIATNENINIATSMEILR
jgi:phage baseplate assembly protein W